MIEICVIGGSDVSLAEGEKKASNKDETPPINQNN